jgi:hypothetical protein
MGDRLDAGAVAVMPELPPIVELQNSSPKPVSPPRPDGIARPAKEDLGPAALVAGAVTEGISGRPYSLFLSATVSKGILAGLVTSWLRSESRLCR